MVSKTAIPVFAFDDEIKMRKFARSDRFIRSLAKRYSRQTSLRQGIEALKQYCQRRPGRAALLFVDVKYVDPNSMPMEVFSLQVKALERRYRCHFVKCALTNHVGSYDPTMFKADLVISKLELPDKARQLRAAVLRLISSACSLENASVLQCGQINYPLLRPLDDSVLVRLRQCLGLASTAARENVEREFHFNFQRIMHTPPHEQTANDRDLWVEFLKYVNMEQYRAENPQLMQRVGTIVSVSSSRVEIEWSGSVVEMYDFQQCAPQIARGKAGDTIAVCYRHLPEGRQEWVDCRISQGPDDGGPKERVAGRRIGSIRSLPVGKWPKITCRG